MSTSAAGAAKTTPSEIYIDSCGWLFALVLTNRYLRLRLFRLLTVARLQLADVQYVRKWSGSDIFGRRRRGRRHRIRTIRWPTRSYPDYAGSKFVMVTRRRKQVVASMTLGMHYKIRVAVADAKLGDDDHRPPHAQPATRAAVEAENP